MTLLLELAQCADKEKAVILSAAKDLYAAPMTCRMRLKTTTAPVTRS
jgi:hypothetical protein